MKNVSFILWKRLNGLLANLIHPHNGILHSSKKIKNVESNKLTIKTETEAWMHGTN